MSDTEKQSSQKAPANVRMTKKTEKTVKFFDNKGKEVMENNKLPKRKDDTKSHKKNAITKSDSDAVNKIQVAETNSGSTIAEDNNSIGQRSLPEISES